MDICQKTAAEASALVCLVIPTCLYHHIHAPQIHQPSSTDSKFHLNLLIRMKPSAATSCRTIAPLVHFKPSASPVCLRTSTTSRTSSPLKKKRRYFRRHVRPTCYLDQANMSQDPRTTMDYALPPAPPGAPLYTHKEQYSPCRPTPSIPHQSSHPALSGLRYFRPHTSPAAEPRTHQ